MNSHQYLLEHSQELSEKHPGKYLALVDDEVVAIGTSSHTVYEKAKKRYPEKMIHITYMPTDEETVTLLCYFRTLR